ncbi:MAG TPA: DUF5117 domain-containing protein, partial [Segetibacter sp.]
MRKLAFLFFTSLIFEGAIAQRPSNPTPQGTTPPGIQGTTPVAPTGPRLGPRPYKEVITDKAITQRGLFTVHQVDDKFYFEIPDNILHREIMAVTRFVRVPANTGATYGGELTNSQTVTFERGPNKNVFMRVVTLVNVADSTNAIYEAVNNSNLNVIAAAFPIAAYGRDSASVVLDVTEFFKGDNQVVSIKPSDKRSLNLSSLAPDRSYISRISTFPTNTEIRTIKTFNS